MELPLIARNSIVLKHTGMNDICFHRIDFALTSSCFVRVFALCWLGFGGNGLKSDADLENIITIQDMLLMYQLFEDSSTALKREIDKFMRASFTRRQVTFNFADVIYIGLSFFMVTAYLSAFVWE